MSDIWKRRRSECTNEEIASMTGNIEWSPVAKLRAALERAADRLEHCAQHADTKRETDEREDWASEARKAATPEAVGELVEQQRCPWTLDQAIIAALQCEPPWNDADADTRAERLKLASRNIRAALGTRKCSGMSGWTYPETNPADGIEGIIANAIVKGIDAWKLNDEAAMDAAIENAAGTIRQQAAEMRSALEEIANVRAFLGGQQDALNKCRALARAALERPHSKEQG